MRLAVKLLEHPAVADVSQVGGIEQIAPLVKIERPEMDMTAHLSQKPD